MYGMELIEANANPDPMKSEVMSRAGELRSEGYDKSTALSMAWDEIGDLDDEEDELEFDEIIPQSRKRRNPKAEDSGIGVIALVGVGAYLLWCFMASVKKGLPWSFTPWKTVPISRRIATPRAIGSTEPVYPARDITQETVTLIVP